MGEPDRQVEAPRQDGGDRRPVRSHEPRPERPGERCRRLRRRRPRRRPPDIRCRPVQVTADAGHRLRDSGYHRHRQGRARRHPLVPLLDAQPHTRETALQAGRAPRQGHPSGRVYTSGPEDRRGRRHRHLRRLHLRHLPSDVLAVRIEGRGVHLRGRSRRGPEPGRSAGAIQGLARRNGVARQLARQDSPQEKGLGPGGSHQEDGHRGRFLPRVQRDGGDGRLPARTLRQGPGKGPLHLHEGNVRRRRHRLRGQVAVLAPRNGSLLRAGGQRLRHGPAPPLRRPGRKRRWCASTSSPTRTQAQPRTLR